MALAKLLILLARVKNYFGKRKTQLQTLPYILKPDPKLRS